jgi:hypothetical protein
MEYGCFHHGHQEAARVAVEGDRPAVTLAYEFEGVTAVATVEDDGLHVAEQVIPWPVADDARRVMRSNRWLRITSSRDGVRSADGCRL